MPALAAEILRNKLAAALPEGSKFLDPPNARSPLRPARVEIPGFGGALLYLWTLTPDRSGEGRPPGEHKIQVILPGARKGAREKNTFLTEGGVYTGVLGFSPDFGVFCGWERRLHPEVGYSTNFQVREPLLDEARATGWAVDEPRQVDAGKEVRVAFTAGNLIRWLKLVRDADQSALEARAREGFLLAEGAIAAKDAAGADVVLEQRRRVSSTRLDRDRKFAPAVRGFFGDACAVCGVQLELVEAAHIVPVSEEGSTDEPWNGIALCRNHHALFDARLLHVKADLTILLDHAVLSYLEAEGRADGAEGLLNPFEGKRLVAPLFWKTDPAMRERMQRALERRLRSSAPMPA